ncbi:MAG: hypothetical protein JWQ33_2487 [Ramlibacter sp.]|nr:hypothetical protein [Ramlibacter sp.]
MLSAQRQREDPQTVTRFTVTGPAHTRVTRRFPPPTLRQPGACRQEGSQ